MYNNIHWNMIFTEIVFFPTAYLFCRGAKKTSRQISISNVMILFTVFLYLTSKRTNEWTKKKYSFFLSTRNTRNACSTIKWNKYHFMLFKANMGNSSEPVRLLESMANISTNKKNESKSQRFCSKNLCLFHFSRTKN